MNVAPPRRSFPVTRGLFKLLSILTLWLVTAAASVPLFLCSLLAGLVEPESNDPSQWPWPDRYLAWVDRKFDIVWAGRNTDTSPLTMSAVIVGFIAWACAFVTFMLNV